MALMYLILGHARSGTMYMARLMARYGFDIGHERYCKDGVAAWQMAVHHPNPPWLCPPRPKGNHTILHIVREPFACIASVKHTDSGDQSMDYRRQWIHIPRNGHACERAALSLLGWTNIIENQPRAAIIRLESANADLARYFGRPPVLDDPGIINARPHPKMSPQRIFEYLSESTAARVRGYCATYGYEWPI